MNSKRLLFLHATLLAATLALSAGTDEDLAKATLTKVGDPAPAFAATATSGESYSLLPDPERKIFSRFAASYIPRLYVIGADGRIKFQNVGFDADEFKAVVAAVRQELAKSVNSKR
jgi:hypothetical protein